MAYKEEYLIKNFKIDNINKTRNKYIFDHKKNI